MHHQMGAALDIKQVLHLPNYEQGCDSEDQVHPNFFGTLLPVVLLLLHEIGVVLVLGVEVLFV